MVTTGHATGGPSQSAIPSVVPTHLLCACACNRFPNAPAEGLSEDSGDSADDAAPEQAGPACPVRRGALAHVPEHGLRVDGAPLVDSEWVMEALKAAVVGNEPGVPFDRVAARTVGAGGVTIPARWDALYSGVSSGRQARQQVYGDRSQGEIESVRRGSFVHAAGAAGVAEEVVRVRLVLSHGDELYALVQGTLDVGGRRWGGAHEEPHAELSELLRLFEMTRVRVLPEAEASSFSVVPFSRIRRIAVLIRDLHAPTELPGAGAAGNRPAAHVNRVPPADRCPFAFVMPYWHL